MQNKEKLTFLETREKIEKTLEDLALIKDDIKLIDAAKLFFDEHFEELSPIEKATVYKMISRASFYNGKNSQAIEFAQKGIDVLSGSPLNEINIHLFASIANSYTKQGKLYQAIESYGKAFEIAALTEDLVIENVITNNIGNIYFSIQDYKNSIKTSLKCIDIIKKVKNKTRLFNISSIIVFINLASSYYAVGDYENVEYFKQKADHYYKEKFGESLKKHIDEISVLLYEKNKDYEKADKLFNEIFEYFKKEDAKSQMTSSLIKYGRNVVIRKEEEQNEENLKKLKERLKIILDIAMLRKNLRNISEAIMLLIDVNYLLKNDEKAYDYYIDYIENTNKYNKWYIREKENALGTHYGNKKVQKDQQLLDEVNLVTQLEKINIKKEEESVLRDYDEIYLVNEIIKKVEEKTKLKNSTNEETIDCLWAEIQNFKACDEIELMLFKGKYTEEKRIYYSGIEENFSKKTKEEENRCSKLFEISKNLEKHLVFSDINELRENLDEKDLELFDKNLEIKPTIFIKLHHDLKLLGIIKFQFNSFEIIDDRDIKILELITGRLNHFILFRLISYKQKFLEEKNNKLRLEIDKKESKIPNITHIDGMTELASMAAFNVRYPYLLRKAINNRELIILLFVKLNDINQFEILTELEKFKKTLKCTADFLKSEINLEDSVLSRYSEDIIILSKIFKTDESPRLFASEIYEKLVSLKEINTILGENLKDKFYFSVGASIHNVEDIKNNKKIIDTAYIQLVEAGNKEQEKLHIKFFDSFSKRSNDI